MNLLNKDVCKVEVSCYIRDTETDCYGDGDTEEEAWKDLENSTLNHFWWLDNQEETLHESLKKELEVLRKRTGLEHFKRDEYVTYLLKRNNELWNELEKFKDKSFEILEQKEEIICHIN